MNRMLDSNSSHSNSNKNARNVLSASYNGSRWSSNRETSSGDDVYSMFNNTAPLFSTNDSNVLSASYNGSRWSSNRETSSGDDVYSMFNNTAPLFSTNDSNVLSASYNGSRWSWKKKGERKRKRIGHHSGDSFRHIFGTQLADGNFHITTSPNEQISESPSTMPWEEMGPPRPVSWIRTPFSWTSWCPPIQLLAELAKKTCNGDGCNKRLQQNSLKAGGLCQTCYYKANPQELVPCNGDGCDKRLQPTSFRAGGLCYPCYRKANPPKLVPCNGDGCNKRLQPTSLKAGGLCYPCYYKANPQELVPCNGDGCDKRLQPGSCKPGGLCGTCYRECGTCGKNVSHLEGKHCDTCPLDKMAKTKKTQRDDPIYWPNLSMTNTSQYSQDQPELPRRSIHEVTSLGKGKLVHWNKVEILTQLSNQQLETQLKECTVSMCIDNDPNSSQCAEVRNVFQWIFHKRSKKKEALFVHSLFDHIHANRHTTELPLSYKKVDSILGLMTKASSVFRCNPEKNNRSTNTKIGKPNMNVFLSKHMDSNRLPTVFLSLSEEDSYVYYRQGAIDVGRLLIPKGLSVIYTTEIHTGSKILNSHMLEHYSVSAPDRYLFRIVHATDKPFDLLQSGLVENLVKTMRIIYDVPEQLAKSKEESNPFDE